MTQRQMTLKDVCVAFVEFGALLGELLVAMLSCIRKIHYQWSRRRRRRRLRPYP